MISDPFRSAIVQSVIQTIRLYEILPWSYPDTTVADKFCNLFSGKMCDFVLSLFADTDDLIDNTERFDTYMSNIPAGSGYRAILHYA